MNKWGALLLWFLYFNAYLDGYQWLRVPLLVQHYIQHKHENPSMNLLDFLHLHYSGFMIYDADWHQDVQLPFKSIPPDNPSLGALNHIINPYWKEQYFCPVLDIHLHNALLPTIVFDFYKSIFISSIFKPPRFLA
ncbi:MAG: hypothetical protein K6T34_00540 [Thermoflavifilum sp.]|nr:hypothetical protein [Thermoflavifilum sp.]